MKNFMEMLKKLWNAIKNEPLLGLLIISNVIIVLILFWYLPLAQDGKRIYEHLLREENNRSNEEQIIKKHEKEIVSIAVYEDVVKSLEHVGDEIKEIRQSLSVVDNDDKKLVVELIIRWGNGRFLYMKGININ